MREFALDCAEIARRRYARGEINRRDFLLALGALGVAPHLAAAQTKELVVVNYGGAAAPAFT